MSRQAGAWVCRKSQCLRRMRLLRLDRTGMIVGGTKLSLQDEAFGIRQAAAEALADLGPKVRSTVPSLVSTLQNDTNSFVRESVVRALGQIGSKRAVAAVIEALKDRDIGVRWYATIELKVLGSKAKEAIPALAQLAVIGRFKTGHQWARFTGRVVAC